MKLYVVVIGNVGDGFSFYGPFTFDEAHDWASANNDCWSVVEVHKP